MRGQQGMGEAAAEVSVEERLTGLTSQHVRRQQRGAQYPRSRPHGWTERLSD